MKTKKTFIPIVTLCAALFLTACTGKGAATTEKPQDSQTEASTEATGDSSTTLDDLYQQENQIFADHEDVWNKVFGMMNKSTADPSGNYADFLASTIESNKDAFTEDELNTLTTDIETIRKIEEQIAEIEKKDTTSESADANDNSGSTSPFRNFSGQDYDGNTVDESLFSGNAVTVINFWFTGCKPCVAELSKLNELNDAIKSMGGEVIGINTETFDGNETAIKEAAAVLESQGAKYRNLSIDASSDAGKYASDIMAFPTTILVDRNGNIVGDPMLGGCNQILLPLCPESVVYTCSLSFLILLIFYQLTIYQIISIFLDSGDINRITCSIPSPYMNLMPETLILHTKVFLSLLHPDLSLSHHFPLPLQSESQPSS